MNLKEFPKDVEVGALVQLTMDMTQTALLRVYEIVALEKRSLTEEERCALDALLKTFRIAKRDVQKLTKRMSQ